MSDETTENTTPDAPAAAVPTPKQPKGNTGPFDSQEAADADARVRATVKNVDWDKYPNKVR